MAMVRYSGLETGRGGILCDCCRNRKQSGVYRCRSCLEEFDEYFDTCTDCVTEGLGCSFPKHEWIECQLDSDGQFETRGRLTTARKVTKAFSSYPSLIKASDPEVDPETIYDLEHRFIRKNKPGRILIYTDGACLRNGQSDPQAGYAFVFRPAAYDREGNLTHPGGLKGRLEDKGPFGQSFKPTSNRAELRAVIAALQFRDWATDCNKSWEDIVFATDSEYVAFGATTWIRNWESEGFVTYDRQLRRHVGIKNQDLWKVLLWEIRRLLAQGVRVLFWRIPREFNAQADENAKLGAIQKRKPEFRSVIATGSRSGEHISVPYHRP